MAKSIRELMQLRKQARAVPTRLVPSIDWPGIVERLSQGETLTFKTECKFALPKNSNDVREYLRQHGYTGKLIVRCPMAEVVILDPCVSPEAPQVERSARDRTGIAPAKRGPGRPRKDSYANGAARH